MAPSTPDAHAKPPTKIREVYKQYQKPTGDVASQNSNLIPIDLSQVKLPAELRQIFASFLEDSDHAQGDIAAEVPQVFESSIIPGLIVYPSLLPPPCQLSLLDKLLHRDIADTTHQTNVHLFHHMVYPPPGASFFSPSASNLNFHPLDPSVHKNYTLPQFLNKKLRWCTLGGQYDWTNKVYPTTPPPHFPADIKALIERLFPMQAEAAILNIYSPGDTLSLHRDVSEECDRPLVSLSLGCDAIFVVGLDAGQASEAKVEVLRLKSGDAVLMSGTSRYAWHGVPRIIRGTCPEWMRDWPGQDGDSLQYEEWKGWMSGKRINLNVRQMFENKG